MDRSQMNKQVSNQYLVQLRSSFATEYTGIHGTQVVEHQVCMGMQILYVEPLII